MESGKGDPDISQMVWLEHIIKGIKRWSSISLTHVIDFIDDDDLHEVLKFTSTLAAKYYQLGVAPGLKSTSLDKIRSDYAGNSDQALNEVRKEHQSINDNHSPLILFIRLKQSKTEQLRKASSKIRAIKLAKWEGRVDCTVHNSILEKHTGGDDEQWIIILAKIS